MERYNLYNLKTDKNFIMEGNFRDKDEVFQAFEKEGYYNKVERREWDIREIPTTEWVLDYIRSLVWAENADEYALKIEDSKEIALAVSVNESMSESMIELFENL